MIQPRFLLTNDDGIHSDGLRALALAFAEIGEVFVVAPDREQSACGHAITMHHPLRVEESQMPGAAKAFAVSGTPADGVKLAIEAPLLEAPPSFVISGINRGPNLGTDVIYSGTVSAALEAVLRGIPAIAVSLCEPSEPGYAYTASLAARLAGTWINSALPPETLLNINVPGVPPEEITGYSLARLGRRNYERVFERRLDPRGRVYYWLAGEPLEDSEPGTDIAAILQNRVSITPLHFDLTRFDVFAQVSEWLDFARPI